MAGVEVDELGEVDVGHPVRVGGAEAPALEPVPHKRNAPARGGLLPRVHALDGEPLRQAVRLDEVPIRSPLWPRQSTKRLKPWSA